MNNNILIERKKKVVTLKINRPDTMNDLNLETLEELKTILTRENNEKTGAVIITGVGRIFSAGADIKSMSKMSTKEAKAFSIRGNHIMNLIENYPKPIIAAINGYALGGGCELALACDFRIASQKAKLGFPEINLGIICGWGAARRLTRLIGLEWSKYLIYSGEIIDASKSQRIGLIKDVVSPNKLLETVNKLAEELSFKPSVALNLVKKVINKNFNINSDEIMNQEINSFAQCFSTEDQKEGMDAFLNKRKPIFK